MISHPLGSTFDLSLYKSGQCLLDQCLSVCPSHYFFVSRNIILTKDARPKVLIRSFTALAPTDIYMYIYGYHMIEIKFWVPSYK